MAPDRKINYLGVIHKRCNLYPSFVSEYSFTHNSNFLNQRHKKMLKTCDCLYCFFHHCILLSRIRTLQINSTFTSNCKSLPSFTDRFAEMRANGDYYITVIEDTRYNKIIGSASLVIERKFIHGCGIRGRLEDVVVDDTYRGKQLGKL